MSLELTATIDDGGIHIFNEGDRITFKIKEIGTRRVKVSIDAPLKYDIVRDKVLRNKEGK